MTNYANENRELTDIELDSVSGGDWVDTLYQAIKDATTPPAEATPHRLR
jgi:hypothetical protein